MGYRQGMKTFLLRSIFFLGWILSPFTFWNDAIVNIPIAYICASLFMRLIPGKFLLLVLIFYWLSNGLGLLMMYFCAKNIVHKGKGIGRDIVTFLITIVVYSIILIALDKIGVLKPIQSVIIYK